MNKPVIAIIGAGNMGSSIISGLIKDRYPPDKLWATDPDNKKLTQLKKTFTINTSTDNLEALAVAKVVVLALKPQVFEKVLTEVTSIIQKKKPLILSIAAGVRLSSIAHWLGNDIATVRCMPNTPALLGCGATGLFANASVTKVQRDLAESIMRSVGITVWLTDEKMLDTVTALSGSGPAYFFYMMEALQQGAEELGLSKEIARLLTLETALGAARMAIESGLSVTELRNNVTSPQGTTEKAMHVLETYHTKAIFKEALKAAKMRSEELAERLEKSE